MSSLCIYRLSREAACRLKLAQLVTTGVVVEQHALRIFYDSCSELLVALMAVSFASSNTNNKESREHLTFTLVFGLFLENTTNAESSAPCWANHWGRGVRAFC